MTIVRVMIEGEEFLELRTRGVTHTISCALLSQSPDLICEVFGLTQEELEALQKA